MNKAEIITELENMVVARLFGRQQWLADQETFPAVHRKLVQMGLMERVCVEPYWQITPLGKEVDVELFEVFIGLVHEWDVVAMILEQYRLLDETEENAVYERMSDPNAESVLRGYAKRATSIIARPLSFYTDFSSKRVKTNRVCPAEIARAPQPQLSPN